jgi:hypothetical protein
MRLAEEMHRSYLARVTFAEASMLILTMWFGLLWPSIAPLTVAPGMTSEQVEAIMGRSGDVSIATGAIDNLSVTHTYFQERITVCYRDGKVSKVLRHKK